MQPDQLLKTEFRSGVAVSVTVLYVLVNEGFSTGIAHPLEAPVAQARPAPVIEPAPVPVALAFRANALGSNLAETYRGAVIESVQTAPDDDVHPDQVLRTEALSGVAVTLAVVAAATSTGQLAPDEQVAAPSESVPTPEPVGVRVTVNAGTKVAVTAFGPSSWSVQASEPVQSPDQAENTEAPGEPFGASWMALPSANRAPHVAPQSMPLGVDVTVPGAPAMET